MSCVIIESEGISTGIFIPHAMRRQEVVDYSVLTAVCMYMIVHIAGWTYGNLRKTLSYGITINPQVDDYSFV